ncbi:hypothetical protein J4467_03315 [Candidatus Woesearchaeota archaeon]|nr:hypothetical protein [Candidatus Woesearchaeota archaeon]
MKKYLLLILFLFLASCATNTTETLPTECPPYCSGGSSSVDLEINSPQDIVFANDRMPVTATVVDSGESGVEYGEVCVTGLDEQYFSGFGGCNCQSYYITLDDNDDENFEESLINFDTTYVSDKASGNHFMTFINRYTYTTYAPFEICFTNDLSDSSCISGNKLESSSSGPLIKADVSIIMFGEANDCGTLNFYEDEDYEASITCKLDGFLLSQFVGGQDTYPGWVRIDYAVEQKDSIEFEVEE